MTYLKSTRPIGLPRYFGKVFTSSWEIRYVRCDPTGGGKRYSSGSLRGARPWSAPSSQTVGGVKTSERNTSREYSGNDVYPGSAATPPERIRIASTVSSR